MRRNQPFEMTLRRDGNHAVVSVAGEIDLQSSPHLAGLPDRPEIRNGVTNVVVDLRATTFMDTSALHALLLSDRALCAGGMTLKLVRGPRNVQRVFDLTGTTRRFTFLEDGETAA